MKLFSKFAIHTVAGGLVLTFAALSHAQGITMATWGGGNGKGWREAFAAPFTAATGIPVNIVEVPIPEAQIRAQKDAPKYNAAISSLWEAAQMMEDGLLEEFDLAEVPALRDVPEKDLLKSPSGRIAGVSVYFTYYGIAVNTDVADPSEFDSWKALGNPKWKDKLSITRPVYSSAYDLTIMSVANGGSEKDLEKGLPLLTQLGRNSLAMYSSMAQMNQLLQRGEVAAAPYYATRVWEMHRAGHKNIAFVIPKEGGLILPYVVVVPKGAKARKEYMQWLNYIAQPEVQVQVADQTGWMPMNSTAKLSPKAEKDLGMSLAELRSQLYQPDWIHIAKSRKERVAMAEKAMTAAAK